MSAGRAEQRNPYKGSPPRCWVRLRLAAPDGKAEEVLMIADTGNPCALIISQRNMATMKLRDALSVNSNFGLLEGGWLRIQMSQLGLDQEILGYASDAVVNATKASSPDFEGLVGLPLSRLLEYGGNAHSFWIAG